MPWKAKTDQGRKASGNERAETREEELTSSILSVKYDSEVLSGAPNLYLHATRAFISAGFVTFCPRVGEADDRIKPGGAGPRIDEKNKRIEPAKRAKAQEAVARFAGSSLCVAT